MRRFYLTVGILMISILACLASIIAGPPKTKIEGQECVKVEFTEHIEVDEIETNEADTSHETKVMSRDWCFEDSYLLAKIAMAEAEGEDTVGKALVMLTVLNRVWSDEFPETIEEVIYQKNQFEPVWNGRFDAVEPDTDCWRALSMIQTDGWDESLGAVYFTSSRGGTWHDRNCEFLFEHGRHKFYR